jgi:hypothetical protein
MATRTTNELASALRSTRANMLGTDDEKHYWDCHDAADELIRLKEIIDDYAAIAAASAREIKQVRQSYARSDEKRCDSDMCGATRAGEIARMRSQPCPYVTGTVTRYCTLTPFTLTDEEREAVAAGLGALERLYEDSPPISKPIYEQHAPKLRALLERTK